MDVSKESLSKLVVRRRLGGGEFTYLLRGSGETVAGKKAAYTLLKEQDSAKFEECKSACKMEGESDEDFDSRMLKLIPGLPYETEVKDEGMDVDGEQDADDEADNEQGARHPLHQELNTGELFTTVKIDNVPNKAKEEECETFFRQFEGVERVKRVLLVDKARNSQNKRNKSKESKPSKKIFKGHYVLTFRSKESASNFLAKPDDEVKFQDRVLIKVLYKKDIQKRVLRGQLWASHHLRLLSCIPLEEGKEENYLMMFGAGSRDQKLEMADFKGEGENFSDIISVKSVVHKIASQNKERVLGHLAEFNDKDARDKFVGLASKGEIKFKDKSVNVNIIGDLKRDIESRYADVKLTGDKDKSVVVLKIKQMFTADIEEKLKEFLGGNVTDIKKDNRNYVVTFDSAEDAARVVASPPENIATVVSPTFLMSLEEYNELKQNFLDTDKARFEKQDEKYKIITEGIKVEGNTILIVDHSKPRMEKEERKARAAEKLTEKLANTKLTEKPEKPVKAAPPSVPKKPMLVKRDNRGPGPFDVFVGVRGFYQKVKNMGKATDIDICNYFIHNHKNVVDVKFVNWSDVVFAKFPDTKSAETFIGLNYAIFFGNELSLVDVETFLKKKSDNQKEELSKILLGKKFSDVKLRGDGESVVNGNSTGGVGKSQVELVPFSSKQADVRNLFIENLNLNDKDVGQLNWIKEQKGFKARIPIKLEEGAIGYLVKKWNDLQIAVGGETVSASLTAAGVKRSANSNRGGRNSTGGGGKRGKFNMLEDY